MTDLFPPQGICNVDRTGTAYDTGWNNAGDLFVGVTNELAEILSLGNEYEILMVGKNTLEYNMIDGGSA